MFTMLPASVGSEWVTGDGSDDAEGSVLFNSQAAVAAEAGGLQPFGAGTFLMICNFSILWSSRPIPEASSSSSRPH